MVSRYLKGFRSKSLLGAMMSGPRLKPLSEWLSRHLTTGRRQ